MRGLANSWYVNLSAALMQFSLPTKPGVDPLSILDDHSGSRLNTAVDPPVMEDINFLRVPPSPDPRTGLLRLDLKWRVADWGKWWVSGPRTALAYHRLKDENVSQSPGILTVRTIRTLG